MIEETIKKYLGDTLQVPVFMEVPERAPESFVVFEKTSGGKRNQTFTATFAFQSYGPSLYEAARLNHTVKEVVEAMIALDRIAFVSLNSDYNFTDTTTKRYRYQAVFDINHY